MSTTAVDNFLRNARDQIAQKDINLSLLKAVTELTREVKRLEDDIRRVRRDVQMSRRFRSLACRHNRDAPPPRSVLISNS
jgi:hypothetical protein